jgi:hypothetical protein
MTYTVHVDKLGKLGVQEGNVLDVYLVSIQLRE